MPAYTRAGMGDNRPRAVVILRSGGGDVEDEEISIPVVVGKTLRMRRRKRELTSLTRKELLDALSDAQCTCAKERMLAHLEHRDLSTEELRTRLSREGFPSFAQEAAIDLALRCKYLDDRRYAERFAHSKQIAGWGELRIRRELSSRGIDTSELAGWPEEFIDVGGERERAYEIAVRKRVKEPHAYEKLVRFLLGRGFSYGISKDVAKEVVSDDA